MRLPIWIMLAAVFFLFAPASLQAQNRLLTFSPQNPTQNEPVTVNLPGIQYDCETQYRIEGSTIAITGYPCEDSVSFPPPDGAQIVISGLAAGTYQVTWSIPDPFYSFASFSGVLTVGASQTSVEAPALSKAALLLLVFALILTVAWAEALQIR